MKRIDTLTAVPDMFGPGKSGWRNGNKAQGIPATEFNADWPNNVQEEICAVIEGAGITLDGDNRTQLLQAIRSIFSGGLATEEVAGIARIATASEVTAGTDNGTIITPAKLANALSTIPRATQATESTAGIAKIATSSQVSSGADDTTIVTPKKMAAALSNLKGSVYKSTNGYAYLTNGVVLVWGRTSNEVSSTVNISWSTAFPSACIFAVGSQTVYQGTSALDAYVQANSLSRTGCTFGVYSYGQGFRASYLYWFAVGY